MLWWNGDGWSLRLSDGTLMKFPSVYGRIRPGRGALMSITDSRGNVLTIERDGEGNILRITSPNHASLTMEHDANNRIVKAADSFGNTVIYSYDDFGRLTEVNDSRQGETRYSYDDADRLVKIVKPGGAVWLRVEYDTYGKVTKLTFEDGSFNRYSYVTDSRGMITAVDVIPSKGPMRRLSIVDGQARDVLSAASGM